MAPPHQEAALMELSDACLQLVVCGLATRDRLAAAAACSRLRSAAAAALSAIAVPRAMQLKLDSVTAYASRHGQHISSMNLDAARRGVALPPALPSACPHLRELRLVGFVLQPGVLGAATGLTRLQLQSCDDAAPAEHSLAANVATATGLVHLELHHCMCATWATSAGAQLTALPGSMLQALPQLTTLALRGVSLVDDGTLAHLSALTGLQELEVVSSVVTAAGLAGLQHLQQLSSLRLLDCRSLAFSGPALAQLSALQSLECTGASQFGPAALAAMRQLQRLVLAGTSVAAADTAVLLQQLGGMQQLSHMNLWGVLQHSTAPAAAYSALTASSKLAFLGVKRGALPEGVWQHMFPAGRQLPQLRELYAELASNMSASDVARLAACCPSLEGLEAELLLGADLQPLVQMSTLTRLVISGIPTQPLLHCGTPPAP